MDSNDLLFPFVRLRGVNPYVDEYERKANVIMQRYRFCHNEKKVKENKNYSYLII